MSDLTIESTPVTSAHVDPLAGLPRSDLQVLPSGTADQVHGVMLKQLREAGIPTWDDILQEVRLAMGVCLGKPG